MGRFFFDIVQDGVLSKDDEGLVLSDPSSAKNEASRTLAAMASEALARSESAALVIEVRDERGLTLFEASLRFEVVDFGGA